MNIMKTIYQAIISAVDRDTIGYFCHGNDAGDLTGANATMADQTIRVECRDGSVYKVSVQKIKEPQYSKDELP